ncbi:hypothetical protein DAPPUDRAFT_275195, partial [Daphnia pulex]
MGRDFNDLGYIEAVETGKTTINSIPVDLSGSTEAASQLNAIGTSPESIKRLVFASLLGKEVVTASTIATSSDNSSTPPTPVNSAASSIQVDDSENDDNNSTSYNSAEDSDSDSSVGTVQHVLQLPIVVPTMA